MLLQIFCRVVAHLFGKKNVVRKEETQFGACSTPLGYNGCPNSSDLEAYPQAFHVLRSKLLFCVFLQ